MSARSPRAGTPATTFEAALKRGKVSFLRRIMEIAIYGQNIGLGCTFDYSPVELTILNFSFDPGRTCRLHVFIARYSANPVVGGRSQIVVIENLQQCVNVPGLGVTNIYKGPNRSEVIYDLVISCPGFVFVVQRLVKRRNFLC